MFKEWLKKYKKSIIVIFVCLLIIGAVITVTILTRPNDNGNSNDAELSDSKNELLLVDKFATGVILTDMNKEELSGDSYIPFFDITSIQDDASMANHYMVNIMHTLPFVNKNGREVKMIIGFHTKEQIEEFFKELRWLK